MPNYDLTILPRFQRKIEQSAPRDPNSCWLWCGARNYYGYGVFRDGPKLYMAHRLMFEAMIGQIPPGLTLDHLCRVRCCINPGHLEIVTKGENVLRGIGLPALNARKSHCKRGHPLTEDNLYKDAGRRCRMCVRLRQYGYYHGGQLPPVGYNFSRRR